MNAQGEGQGEGWDTAAAERAVAVLKAVADPSRYRLLWALSRRELPVSELARMLDAHVAATSQHLAKLRAAGLVVSRREGTRIFYRAVDVAGLLEQAQLLATADEVAAARAEATGTATATAAAPAPAPARARATVRRPATEA
ncbi:ArsR/SmtB family transcription factor [Streptomyces sp. NPDC090025]|uniref:ArsR/SmtB family transcription factor n=1 Tax=Streptomyces sp. NPDC090025 TaxID=3365922 RepID=UPI00383252E4